MKMMILLLLSIAFATTASQETAKREARQIKAGLKKFRVDCGQYPSIEMGLAALLQKPKQIDCKKWKAYLGQLPKDPWGRPWLYESDGETFTLASLGADGKEGGAGEDMDIQIRP